MYADGEGVGEALAELLGGDNVAVAETLDSAFASDSEVIVLALEGWREERLAPATAVALQRRKLVVTGTGAIWLIGELDLDIGDGMSGDARPLRTAASWLADEAGEVPFEALARPQAEHAYLLRQDPRHITWHLVPEELRLEGDKGFIETLVHLDEDVTLGVVTRQANCVYAGVMAHPNEWSRSYRNVFGRLVSWLSARALEDFRLAVVPKQVHPPGTTRFPLDPFGLEGKDHRTFFFQFDRPATLTATLRHSGSDAVMLLFRGGKRGLYFTREDAEHGEPVTVAVTVGQRAIDAMAGRYWILDVANWDPGNGMSAELTVQYDDADEGAIRSMPSDASFEHFHWFAERLEAGDAAARRQATAEAFGFDDWRSLQDHVGWSEAKLPEDGAPMREMQLQRARAKYAGPIGPTELLESVGEPEQVAEDLHRAVEGAFRLAGSRGHQHAGVEHLLLTLLDNPITEDVLAKCGANLAGLRDELVRSLESAEAGEAPTVSPELFGVLIRAECYRALGREGSNAANVLVGMFAEPSHARDLLEGQGLGRDDVLRYLVFGIARSLSTAPPTKGILAAPVERAVYEAYRDAEAKRHMAFGVDHLLLALLDPTLEHEAASAGELRRLRSELASFVTTTPVGDGRPRPTRKLDFVMQRAEAGRRSSGNHRVDAKLLIDAIGAEAGTFAADALRRYGRRAGAARQSGSELRDNQD